MKKVFGFLLAVCLGVALDRMLSGIPVTAAAGGGQGGVAVECAAKNGDVNGSGKVDLSDATTILGHLFLGNPTKLVGLCAAPPAPSGLPDTGQTALFGDCAGQVGSYATGCPTEGRFVDNADGTVTDNCTGLMWQKDTADVNGDGQTLIDDRSDVLNWCNALAYCENLSFAGHDDWRLPNVRELQSIADYGRFNPSIDPVFGAVSTFYWSSTSGAGNPDCAWGVRFGHGDVYDGDDKDGYYVRAVRSGP